MIREVLPTRNLKIVTLAAPYDSIDAPAAGDLLVQAVQLKLAGYRDVYPYGVLPVDTYDFISTHHLAGFEDETGFHARMAFRTVELEKCELHRLPFPGVMILRNSCAYAHTEVLESMLAQWKGRRVSYASSWSMDPALRHDPEMRRRFREMMVGMLINHELDRRSDERLLCGVPKVHTDELMEKFGYSRVKQGDAPLPPFNQASLVGEPAVLLHCQGFNGEALRMAETYRELWDARTVIGEFEPNVRKAA